MRYYIATALDNAPLHNALRDALQAQGHEITHDWTQHGVNKDPSLLELRSRAEKDVDGVVEGEAFIAILPGGRGTHVELGMALGGAAISWFVRGAYDPKIIIYAPNTRALQDPCPCAFYCHPAVTLIVGGDPVERILKALEE